MHHVICVHDHSRERKGAVAYSMWMRPGMCGSTLALGGKEVTGWGHGMRKCSQGLAATVSGEQ